MTITSLPEVAALSDCSSAALARSWAGHVRALTMTADTTRDRQAAASMTCSDSRRTGCKYGLITHGWSSRPPRMPLEAAARLHPGWLGTVRAATRTGLVTIGRKRGGNATVVARSAELMAHFRNVTVVLTIRSGAKLLSGQARSRCLSIMIV
ncbi:hypothetical protein [Sphingomonas phyllosphaerae]|uniref:hypothetical protein n=1 Tax=Sphingomonas phyllosphaerae TaxID=257003 RepID=UPI0012DF0E3E|nr:hypothetical protein [Sphingomonas phyllosphaerae]